MTDCGPQGRIVCYSDIWWQYDWLGLDQQSFLKSASTSEDEIYKAKEAALSPKVLQTL